ncbi:MAG: UDP-N-acetylmuramoyl-L-alanyl-D-glutamate--2,6-diaminopimelate ligase [Parcubacteria group bacterium LiPW_15]|nr:MAG: UDP-N-acetylmuramoyl-L-alanyl-D-glutamate--2,6-diaminopimelate ligase [Parcubacteria group bacterium LiPW_15]
MLGKIKRSFLFRWIYKLPWLLRGYHLLFTILGAIIYRRPSRFIRVIGITGTKGKTTALELLNSIFESAGEKTALLSSVRVKIGEKSKRNLTENSMPGRMYIQRFLRKAVNAGCAYAFVEATSQGAVLYRHALINWAAAALTNIHPEHIEAHGSYEKYREAKLRFLAYAGGENAPIFLNGEEEEKDFFERELKGNKIIIYSTEGLRDLPESSREYLPGHFSKQNVALAVAVAKEFGIPDEKIWEGIANFKGAPGRVDIVQRKPFKVVVDYAHTPESLAAIYKALKEELSGGARLTCLLGAAGGGRDKWKRPAMGKTAAEYCDRIILTDEDPYDEDSAEIISEIKKGIREAGFPENEILEMVDRRAAIREAIKMARPGDTIISTGKGSESWIHIKKGEKIPWNEKQIFEEELGIKK